MRTNELIKKIKGYSVIAFLLPLLTINSCLLLYKFLGNISLYPALNWGEKKIEVPLYKHDSSGTFISDSYKYLSLIDCPKFKYKKSIITTDGEILDLVYQDEDGEKIDIEKNFEKLESLENKNLVKAHLYQQDNRINYKCVKNYKYMNSILSNFSFLENALINAKKNSGAIFSSIKNPYFYGEVSISRTARYFPATLIFKPFIILSAIFLLLYWRNNLHLFDELKNNNTLSNFSKSFFYFGVLSCLFLIMHAALLGLDIDSKLFTQLRKIIIASFIFFELSAQILLTRILFKYRNELKKYTHLLIIKIKMTFISVAIFLTIIIFALLAWGDLSTNMKHIFEWNYFSALLFYYLLSRLLWKS